jgi:Tol biopolymer transport system component
LFVVWTDKKDTSGKYQQKKLTNDNYNVNAFDWSPDGKYIAYSHGKSPEQNDNVYSDISMIEVATRAIKSIAKTSAGESNPQFSPDGEFIAYYSTTDPVDWSGPDHGQIYSLADGKSWRLKATPDEAGAIVGWTADGKNIIWSEANGTVNNIYILSADGKSITPWTKGLKDVIGGISMNANASYLGFTLQNPSQLPEAYVSSLNSFSPVKITRLNADYGNKPLPKTELIKWKAADGREIEGR